MALLSHEENYHSLDNVTTLLAEKGKDLVAYQNNKYSEGNLGGNLSQVLEEI